MDLNNTTTGRLRLQPRKSLGRLDSQNDHHQNCNDDDKKKMMHRDLEKKRRHEMAALYASLRSVLPHQYINSGKRSLVDHMDEAENYIKQLQRRIKTLGADRDELKRLSNLSVAGPAGNVCVAVHPNCLGGIEIVISSSTTAGGSGEQLGGSGEQGGLVLSRLLEILVGQGLTVISCAAAQLNQRLVYTIQSQDSDPTCIDDFSGLQQNLTEAISSSILFSK